MGNRGSLCDKSMSHSPQAGSTKRDYLLSPPPPHPLYRPCHRRKFNNSVRKVVGGFGKKSCVSTGVRKPENSYASPTAMI